MSFHQVLAKIRLGTSLHGGRVPTLVLASRRHRRLIRRREQRRHHGLCQLLPLALDHHASPAVQDPQGGLLLPQCGHQDAVD